MTDTLASVVQNFVTSLLALPLSELAQNGGLDPVDPIARWASKEPAPAKSLPKKGRLARRTPEAIERDIVRVLAFLAKHPECSRAEEISSSLSLSPREMPRILGDAVKSKRLVRKGKARGTHYSLPTTKTPAKAVKRPAAKKTAKKGAKKTVKKAAKKTPKKAAPVIRDRKKGGFKKTTAAKGAPKAPEPAAGVE
jgi:hypothetical protein